MFKDNIINNINEIPVNVKMDMFKKYKLEGLISTKFNNNLYEIFNYLYPNKWSRWDYNRVTRNFYEIKENRIKTIRDLIIKDNLYSKEDLIKIANINYFKINGIISLVCKYYAGSPIKCIIECFPEFNIYEWEFKQCPNGYWESEDNRKNSFKQLIEYKLLLKTKEDIIKTINNKYLLTFYPKFFGVLNIYYKRNVYNWINDIYPNQFKITDFNNLITKDNIKVNNKIELLLHNFILDNFSKYILKYTGFFTRSKKYKFTNYLHNENYVPDWIMYDDNNIKLIIEYFGWYNIKSDLTMYKDYKLKTNRKIEFFTDYCIQNPDYKFLALFPEDLKHSLTNIQQKLNNILN